MSGLNRKTGWNELMGDLKIPGLLFWLGLAVMCVGLAYPVLAQDDGGADASTVAPSQAAAAPAAASDTPAVPSPSPAAPQAFVSPTGSAQGDFAKGEALFMQNKPKEALPFLEAACAADPAHVAAFLYLGIAYQQLNMVDEAIACYRRILPRGGAESARIAYNLGNAYYVKGNAVFADQFYTQAIAQDQAYAPAYLNRANARVKAGQLKEAVSDYDTYLTLEPRSPQRPQIERLISFIREEFAAADRQRIAAEEAAKAEAERKKKLLEEVSASLQAASSETYGLTSPPEDVQKYDGEFELQ